MRLMAHVRRSSDGRFEVRIVVPKSLRSTIGKTNLTQRLGRLSKSEVNRRAAPVIERFQEQIEQARSGTFVARSDALTNAVTIAEATNQPTSMTVPLMALFDAYVAERQPSPATIKRWRRVINHLIDHLGHDDARRIGADDIIGWKEALAAKGASGRTIREVYLASAKVVFAWSVENRKLPTNPAIGISVRVPIRRRTRGPSFTPDEARTILSGALARDQGGISPEHALARRWIPWLCAYSGARVGEIAQMRGDDIVQIEGIWAMRITPEAGSTKNGRSRTVALHPHLVEQGLPEVARRAANRPIFFNPERGRGGSAGNAHHNKVGERLARWVRGLGVDDPHVQPNHGWRHLFKTSCRRAGIAPEVRDAIQGHAPRNVGEAYGEWPIDVLAEAIRLLPRFEVGPTTFEVVPTGGNEHHFVAPGR
jgi:integrase